MNLNSTKALHMENVISQYVILSVAEDLRTTDGTAQPIGAKIPPRAVLDGMTCF